MENYLESFFWLLLAMVVYVYFGYGLLMWVLVKVRNFFRKPVQLSELSEAELPEITFIIAAYNEEADITQKIENTLSLKYPSQKMKVWVVADGSTDNTVKIAEAFEEVKVWFQPKRKGKIHAVNRVMPNVETPITVFSDANTLLNEKAVVEIAHAFANENVGVVAGEKTVIPPQAAAAEASEGIYWKYESFLKKISAQWHSATGAAGELFAIRTALYSPVQQDTLIEDFVLSVQIAMKGFTIAYAPNAKAYEGPSANVEEEQKRKIRIAAGGWQASWRLGALWNPFRYGWLSVQFVSHRFLRWTLVPFSLPVLLLLSALLIAKPLFVILFSIQLAFYAVSLTGHFLRHTTGTSKWIGLPYYFCMMNISAIKGFFRWIKRTQNVTWEKAQRSKINFRTA